MSDDVKIIQIVAKDNDPCWQGALLGLGSDGVVYVREIMDGKEGWIALVPLKFHGNKD